MNRLSSWQRICAILPLLSLIAWEATVWAGTATVTKPVAGKGKEKMALTITSTAFKHEGMIPKQFTCDGTDISPALSWTGVPEGVKSFALICDDPDAPVGTWIHWVIFNIPADARELKEKIPADTVLANGARHGINSWKKVGYGGPCPPSGTHRYFFKLYALDTALNLAGKVAKEQLLEAMKGHIVAQAELMGKYSRK